MAANKIRFGTSGWSYKDWLGPFYPTGTKQADYLNFYSQKFNTVEIDSTFYGTPRPTTVVKWAAITADNFIFCPKVPQIITHEKRLYNCTAEWNEYAETMQLLGQKLGPLVLQFDYKFTYSNFFENLKSFIAENKHDLRLCIEVRHKSWINEQFYDFLRSENMALVLNDLHYMPRLTELTADFTYIRFLGNRKMIPDDFSHRRIDRSKELDWWQEWITKFLQNDIEVFVFSNNRYEGFAPDTITDLTKRLKI